MQVLYQQHQRTARLRVSGVKTPRKGQQRCFVFATGYLEGRMDDEFLSAQDVLSLPLVSCGRPLFHRCRDIDWENGQRQGDYYKKNGVEDLRDGIDLLYLLRLLTREEAYGAGWGDPEVHRASEYTGRGSRPQACHSITVG
nr:hypothetical protein CFP56_69877 [Quercus suber]